MKRRWGRDPFDLALRTAALAIFLALLLPLLVILGTSLNRLEVVQFPPQGLSLSWYKAIFEDPFIWKDAFGLSLRIALITVALSLLLGYSAALGMRYAPEVAKVLDVLLLSPLFVGFVVLGLALLMFFNRVWPTLGATPAIIVAHTLISAPYVLRIARATLHAFDPAMEEAASNLGASGRQVLWKVTLPIIRPGIIAGGIFAFILSFNNVMLSLMLAKPGLQTLPVFMFNQIQYSFNPLLASISFLLILFMGVTLILVDRVVGFERALGLMV
ncbi:MAG: ABC transporter permease [Nitrospinota bacterium]